MRILTAIARGKIVTEIAKELGVSARTVDVESAAIKRILRAYTLPHAVHLAHIKGLLDH